jgi:hypothetical protein
VQAILLPLLALTFGGGWPLAGMMKAAKSPEDRLHL